MCTSRRLRTHAARRSRRFHAWLLCQSRPVRTRRRLARKALQWLN